MLIDRRRVLLDSWLLALPLFPDHGTNAGDNRMNRCMCYLNLSEVLGVMERFFAQALVIVVISVGCYATSTE